MENRRRRLRGYSRREGKNEKIESSRQWIVKNERGKSGNGRGKEFDKLFLSTY